MSGGYLDDYGYFRLHETIEAIEDLIFKNSSERTNDWGERIEPYSSVTIDRFREAIRALKRAYVYAQRIDWLVSGDDDEKTFHERLPEDLAKIY